MNFIPRASLAIFAFAVATPASAQPAPERLKTLFEQQWENTLREAPVFATTLGDTRYNDRLSDEGLADRKSTRLNSSHSQISYAVFCLKKKITKIAISSGDP